MVSVNLTVTEEKAALYLFGSVTTNNFDSKKSVLGNSKGESDQFGNFFSETNNLTPTSNRDWPAVRG